ncbi:hypothetical protein OHS70_33795 [Streptomyces sp. NBC_00390]|uniref:hypothetical protein n=1 Tax=Streptomyces sp. NBC_00390 TaxID=2975736 RepID=UPI002E2298E5
MFYPVLERLSERFGSTGARAPEDVVSFVRTDTADWAAESEEDDRAVLAMTLGQPPQRVRRPLAGL